MRRTSFFGARLVGVLTVKVGDRVQMRDETAKRAGFDSDSRVKWPIRGEVVAIAKQPHPSICIAGSCVKVRRDDRKQPSWYWCGYWRRTSAARLRTEGEK